MAKNATIGLMGMTLATWACDGAPGVALHEQEVVVADPAPVEIAEMEELDTPAPIAIGGELLGGAEVAPVDGVEVADALGFGAEDASPDRDADGVPADLDCDDTDPAVSPRAVEEFCDGRDQNCNGRDECDTDRDGAHDSYDLDPFDPAVGAARVSPEPAPEE